MLAAKKPRTRRGEETGKEVAGDLEDRATTKSTKTTKPRCDRKARNTQRRYAATGGMIESKWA